MKKVLAILMMLCTPAAAQNYLRDDGIFHSVVEGTTTGQLLQNQSGLLGGISVVIPITPQQKGAVGNGVADDTAAIVSALASAKGGIFQCVPGSTYSTDPIVVNSTNAPSVFSCYGATFVQRSGATACIKFENPQDATGFTGLRVDGLACNANSLGSEAILIHGMQPLTANNVKSISFSNLSAKGATGCGFKLLGEPGFGVYSNSFSNIHSTLNGTGFCDQSINNSGNNYSAANEFNNTHSDGAVSAGYFIDYGENLWNNPRAEATTAGPGVSLGTTLGSRFVAGHMENNLLATVDTSFAGTPGSSLGIKIEGTNISGVVTGLIGQRGNTVDVVCAIGVCVSGVTDGFNADYVLTQGISINGAAKIINTVNGTGGGGLHLAAGGADGAVVGTTGLTIPASKNLLFTGASSGTATVTPQTAAGTPTINWPTASGTLADGASSPLVLNATTGNLTCPTCTTSAAALTANQLVIGSGSQGEQSLGSLGTATTLLHGNAGGAPTFGAVVSADLNITTTTCTNQFVSAISATGIGTCASITAAETPLTNTHILVGNVSNVAADVALSGDATMANTGALTLASVVTAGTTGSSTAIPVITIDVKGRTTTITTAAVVAPAGTLTGTTLASNINAFNTTIVNVPNTIAFGGTSPGALSGSGAINFNGAVGNGIYVNGIQSMEWASASANAVFKGTLSVAGITNVATTSSVCVNTGTGLLTYDGTLGTCTVSDERLKNMGERIPDALNRLLQINGVYYTWKDPKRMGKGRQIGVGAQTVEKVFPELVQADSSGYKSADYQRLVAPIIEALRELKANNDNLKARLAVLENKRGMR